MSRAATILGLDVGSVTLGLVELTPSLELVRQVYLAHEGKVQEVLAEVLRGTDAASLAGIACTSSTPPLVDGDSRHDSSVACITTIRHFHPEGRDIERAMGVPVVTVTYDGTSSFKNDVVVPFIKYRRSSRPREG